MYKFEKVAGLILDHQDDPGFGWDYISQWWPDELEAPQIGQEFDKEACIAIMSHDGFEKIARYPTDTPENALASSMYFMAFGVDALEKEAQFEIANKLQEARISWGTSMPREFVDELLGKTAEVEEVYADYDEHLPVTTPEQTQASIALFEKNSSKWPADQRMILASRLEKAASVHGMETDIPLAKKTVSSSALVALEKRAEMMGTLFKNASFNARHEESFDGEEFETYLSGLDEVIDYLDSVDSYQDVVKIASYLEELDKAAGMDECWGVEFPDAIDSILYGVYPEKTASYANVDWDGLKDMMSSDYVDAIAEDPETIIPTLPTPERKIVEDYVRA